MSYLKNFQSIIKIKSSRSFLIVLSLFFVFSFCMVNFVFADTFVSDAKILDKANLKQEAINIQNALNQILVPSPNLKADGVFSVKTIEALKTFQLANKLKADGVAGFLTRTALRKGQVDLISGKFSADNNQGINISLQNNSTGNNIIKNNPINPY